MNSKVIIDTSILVKWLNQTNEKDIEKADQLMESALDGKVQLFAPELAKYELGNVLLKGKQLTPNEEYISLSTAYSLPINFVSESEELAKDTYSIAFDFDVTYYDASFLSLAKQLNAILVTENIKHQGKAKNIVVKSLKDF
jgi:predicted nucleic acid-binding protein